MLCSMAHLLFTLTVLGGHWEARSDSGNEGIQSLRLKSSCKSRVRVPRMPVSGGQPPNYQCGSRRGTPRRLHRPHLVLQGGHACPNVVLDPLHGEPLLSLEGIHGSHRLQRPGPLLLQALLQIDNSGVNPGQGVVDLFAKFRSLPTRLSPARCFDGRFLGELRSSPVKEGGKSRGSGHRARPTDDLAGISKDGEENTDLVHLVQQSLQKRSGQGRMATRRRSGKRRRAERPPFLEPLRA